MRASVFSAGGNGAWKGFSLMSSSSVHLLGWCVCMCMCRCGVCICRLRISVFIKHNPTRHTPHHGHLGPGFSLLTMNGAWPFLPPGWVLEHSLLIAALWTMHLHMDRPWIDQVGCYSLRQDEGIPSFPNPVNPDGSCARSCQKHRGSWSNGSPSTIQHP